MPDYSKGKIYAIRAPGTDDVYIGSTCVSLAQRMAQHRRHLSCGKNITSTKMLERPGAYIELIEDCPCERIEQLNKREGEIIRAHPTAVNKQIAGRTPAEYYADNREAKLEKQMAYARAHKAEKAAYDTAYKAKRAAYNATNRDTINAQRRARYAAKNQSETIPAPTLEQDAHVLRPGAQEILR